MHSHSLICHYIRKSHWLTSLKVFDPGCGQRAAYHPWSTTIASGQSAQGKFFLVVFMAKCLSLSLRKSDRSKFVGSQLAHALEITSPLTNYGILGIVYLLMMSYSSKRPSSGPPIQSHVYSWFIYEKVPPNGSVGTLLHSNGAHPEDFLGEGCQLNLFMCSLFQQHNDHGSGGH